MIRPLTVLIVSLMLAAPASAHEGHGLPGPHHWHATDVLGFLVAAAVIAAAIWWVRRK